MKKLLVLASLLAAVAVAGCGSEEPGCGSEEPASAPAKAPEAAPAQKVEQKAEYNEKGERVYKSSGERPIIGGSGNQVHQFKE